jgi:hypothetical protein
MPSQPQDEWTYLRAEEFADDDAVERVGEAFDVGAEDAALHLIDLDEPQVTGEALDPGETLVVGTTDGPAVQYFDDEEPEPDHEAGRRADDGTTDDALVRTTILDGDEPDEEPGLDDILASQHYSFEPESQ